MFIHATVHCVLGSRYKASAVSLEVTACTCCACPPFHIKIASRAAKVNNFASTRMCTYRLLSTVAAIAVILAVHWPERSSAIVGSCTDSNLFCVNEGICLMTDELCDNVTDCGPGQDEGGSQNQGLICTYVRV